MPKVSDRSKKRKDKESTGVTTPSSSNYYGTPSSSSTSSSPSSVSSSTDTSLSSLPTNPMDITEYNSSASHMDNDDETIELSGTSIRASSSAAAVYQPSAKLTTVDEELEIIGFGRYQFIAILILGLANAADAIELLCASFILPQLPDFTDYDKSFLSSAIFIGMLIGGLFFGIASDFLGRKLMLIIALLINAVFGALSALAPTQPYTLLILCRIIAGFGVGGSIPGVFTLTVEILPVKNRGFWLSVVAWWWMIGSIYGAGMAWLMIGTLQLSWRYFALICALPALIGAILIIFLLYESPRYLHLNGNIHAAEKILHTIALWNKTETRLAKGYRLIGHTNGDNNDSSSSGPHPSSSFPMYKDTTPSTKITTTKTTLKNFIATNPNNTTATGSSGNAPASSAFVIADDDDDQQDDTNDISVKGASYASKPTTKSNKLSPSDDETSLSDETMKKNNDDGPISLDEEQGLLSNDGNKIGKKNNNSVSSSSSSSTTVSPYSRKQQIYYINRCCFCSRNGKLGRKILYNEIMRPLSAFFSPGIRRTSILLMVIWFSLSLGWYGLTLWIPTIFHESNVNLNEYQDAFLVQAANLPGNLLSAVLMDRLGRKGVLIWSLILAGIAAIAFPFTNSEVTTVLCACLLNAASTCTWNALDCLSTESFPTALRTTSMGVLAASGRIGSIIGQFIFGALIHVSLFALLGVAGGVLVCGSIAGFLLPKEPKGKKLDENVL